jgi:elongator complex protein 4
MSFRKQNRGLSGPFTRGPPGIAAAGSDSAARREAASDQGQAPGIRPSPLDGRPTTSTGAPSLDGLLAGHAGLALGNSLLLEEGGTTDYAGTLLRYYAAEGVVQGHAVHVIGVGEHWGRELPGLVGAAAGEEEKGVEKAKMKIAWRYERLGEFGGKDGRGWVPLCFGFLRPLRIRVYRPIYLLFGVRVTKCHADECSGSNSKPRSSVRRHQSRSTD